MRPIPHLRARADGGASLLSLSEREKWMDAAACIGLSAIFDDEQYAATAKAVCAICPVIDRCRDWGDHVERGVGRQHLATVIGGETVDERVARRRAQVLGMRVRA